jgi:hypothetical protein
VSMAVVSMEVVTWRSMTPHALEKARHSAEFRTTAECCAARIDCLPKLLRSSQPRLPRYPEAACVPATARAYSCSGRSQRGSSDSNGALICSSCHHIQWVVV